MQRSFSVHALLAAAALLVAGAAHAQSTATATYGFQILLTDLDPSDGIDPSVTLDPASRSSAFASSSGTGASWQQQGDSAFGPVSAGGQVDGTGGSASFSGDPFGAGATLLASAAGGPSLDVGSAVTAASSLFTLSPHTEVTFSGVATADWNASNPNAAAYDEIDVNSYRVNGDFLDLDWMGYVVGGYYGTGFGPLSGSTPGSLGFTFDNLSDDPIALAFQIAVYANASEFEFVLPPVDEPGGGILLLAGASAILCGLRRNGRSSASSAAATGSRS
jgi:hypothetical protein